MKLSKLCFLIIVLSLNVSFAEEDLVNENEKAPQSQSGDIIDSTINQAEKITNDVTNTLNETRDVRAVKNYYLLANYSPLDLLIPSKIGLTLGLVNTVDSTTELEYLHGSISVPFIVEDLGKMSDDRISIIRRSYFGGNSFNLSYGLTYFDFSMHLGDKLLNRVSGGTYPAMELVNINSLGFNVAVGNRWAFKNNITIGLDWFSWAQPIYTIKKNSAFLDYATNQDDINSVNKSMTLISYFPRFALLKFQLGMLF